MSDWKYIDEYNSLPAADFVHCDTRDFHILCVESEDTSKVLKEIKKANGTLSDCKFRRDEILGTLRTLENESGGKGQWRMITTESHPEWLKYIRFVKTTETIELVGRTEPVYIAYSNRGNTYNVLSRKVLSETPVEKYLNHIRMEV